MWHRTRHQRSRRMKFWQVEISLWLLGSISRSLRSILFSILSFFNFLDENFFSVHLPLENYHSTDATFCNQNISIDALELALKVLFWSIKLQRIKHRAGVCKPIFLWFYGSTCFSIRLSSDSFLLEVNFWFSNILKFVFHIEIGVLIDQKWQKCY